MDETAGNSGAFDEAVVFLRAFEDLPDARQAGKVRYHLTEVLLLCLLAVLAGAETFVDIALFGDKKLSLLRRFRPFAGGTPSHDHLGDIFATLDAEAFQRCFVAWVASMTGAPADVIAICDADTRAVVPVKSRFSTNSGQALRQAALSGMGVILQVEELLADDVTAGRLMHILADWQSERPMHIVYAPYRRITPKLRSFLDFVTARFGRQQKF